MMEKSFEEQVARCTFLPWRGCDYARGSTLGVRTLVVGESHYDYDDAESRMPDDMGEWTRRVVSDWCHKGDATSFLPRLEESILGFKTHDSLERIRLWHSIAFANFVQTPMESRWSRPAREHFAASEEPFMDVLEALMPDCVLVYSVKSWNHLPPYRPGETARSIEVNARLKMEWYTFDLKSGHPVTAFRLHHASRFSPMTWHPAIKEALALSRRHAMQHRASKPGCLCCQLPEPADSYYSSNPGASEL